MRNIFLVLAGLVAIAAAVVVAIEARLPVPSEAPPPAAPAVVAAPTPSATAKPSDLATVEVGEHPIHTVPAGPPKVITFTTRDGGSLDPQRPAKERR